MDRDADSNSLPFGPTATFEILRVRAELMRRLRAFFDDRGFLEVETPLLSREVIAEAHIKTFSADWNADTLAWLQASPEAHMKRLLAAGAPSIYQATRSFRRDEQGELHNPEFTIVEWYALGDDMAAGMDRLDALLQTVLGAPPAIRTSYREAFLKYAGVDPYLEAAPEPRQRPGRSERPGRLPRSGSSALSDDDLNQLLFERVEPNLGRDTPEIIFDYPASQAAFAKIRRAPNEVPVAERFELYWRGVELANGYHELSDATEFRARLREANEIRSRHGKPVIPDPEKLLAAMDAGLPPCAGVALGFDRLVMATRQAAGIDDVMAFPGDRA